MKNGMKLSIKDIKRLIKIYKPKDYMDWDGDTDGGTLEGFLDELFPNYVRAGLDNSKVIFLDKKKLDERIDSISKCDNDAIIQRLSDRTQIDWWRTDYIDYYYDLVDPIYVGLTKKKINVVYVNLFDYILDRIIKNPKNELQYLKNSIDDKIHKLTRWRDDAVKRVEVDDIFKTADPYNRALVVLQELKW